VACSIRHFVERVVAGHAVSPLMLRRRSRCVADWAGLA
jgi:hypothetical protein